MSVEKYVARDQVVFNFLQLGRLRSREFHPVPYEITCEVVVLPVDRVAPFGEMVLDPVCDLSLTDVYIEPRMDLLETMPAEIGALESYRKKDDASKVRAQVRDHLLDQGYVLDPANGNETYTIYIVNLIDESAPDPAPGKWVYVGETSKTPEERFDEHKNGIRDNKAAREYGRDLNYELMKEIPQVRFKLDSKCLEAQTGEELRGRGYVVEGGH